MSQMPKKAYVDIKGDLKRMVETVQLKYPNLSASKIINALTKKGAEVLEQNPEQTEEALLRA